MAIISKDLFKKIHRIEIQTTRLVEDVLAGAYRSAFKGNGMEFEDVREYQTGDDVRSIDWNVTARMNMPYIKKFREERELTVMLLVDISASSRFGTVNRLKSELIAEVGAVIAYSAIKNNDKIGLILFSSEVEKYIPPNRGSRHVLRVIRELLAFEPKHPKTDIGSVLSFLAEVQKRTSLCFLISDFLADLKSHQIKVIAKKHDLIGISIRDPKEMQLPSIGLVQLRDLETGEYLLVDSSSEEVQKTFTQMAKAQWNEWNNLMISIGKRLLQLQTDKPYSATIRKYFEQREKQK